MGEQWLVLQYRKVCSVVTDQAEVLALTTWSVKTGKSPEVLIRAMRIFGGEAAEVCTFLCHLRMCTDE